MHQIVEDILEARQREHEFDLYVQEEMHKLPPCEGINHAESTWGHQAQAPAAYLLIYPCGRSLNVCAPWVDVTEAQYTFAKCGPAGCDGMHLVSDLVYVPLDVAWND